MPQTTPIQISVINASTVVSDAEVQPVVDALQQQVTHDFGPLWGVDAALTFVPGNSTPPSNTWWLSILDDSDQAGALGYHDLTPEGLPLGKVFAGTDLKYGSIWSVTASHELLEMLGDPNINLTVLVQPQNVQPQNAQPQSAQTAGTLYAYELCDACEDDSFAYTISGVKVSDFVYPSWFEDFRAENSTQFDQQKRITKPFQLLTGGYIGVFDVNSGTGWHQITDEILNKKKPTSMKQRGTVGSRRERRRIPRYQWITSRTHREIQTNAKKYRERVMELRAERAAA